MENFKLMMPLTLLLRGSGSNAATVLTESDCAISSLFNPHYLVAPSSQGVATRLNPFRLRQPTL